MVKAFKNILLKNQRAHALRDVGPAKFVKIMILGWPWPTLCQICFRMHLNGCNFWKVDFLEIVEAKVIILT